MGKYYDSNVVRVEGDFAGAGFGKAKTSSDLRRLARHIVRPTCQVDLADSSPAQLKRAGAEGSARSHRHPRYPGRLVGDDG